MTVEGIFNYNIHSWIDNQLLIQKRWNYESNNIIKELKKMEEEDLKKTKRKIISLKKK